MTNSAALAEHQKHLILSQFESPEISDRVSLAGEPSTMPHIPWHRSRYSLPPTMASKAEIDSPMGFSAQVCVPPISEETGPGAPHWAPAVR